MCVKEAPDRGKVVDLKRAQDDDERDAVEHPLGVHVFLFVYLCRRPRKPDERHQHGEHRPKFHVPAVIEEDGQHLVFVPSEPRQAYPEHKSLF